MESFDEDELNRLLSGAIPSKEVVIQQLEAIKDRLERFLEERGVVFDIPSTEDLELVEQVQINKIELNALATIIGATTAMNEYKEAQGKLDPDYKKRLQATYIVNGFGGPWLEVIDNELPGLPLTDEDSALITEVALETIQRNQENVELWNSRFSQMEDFLSQRGVVDLSSTEIAVLSQLVILSARFVTVNNSVRFIEDARNILFKNNLDDPAWFSLVEVFFSQI